MQLSTTECNWIWVGGGLVMGWVGDIWWDGGGEGDWVKGGVD